MRTCKNCGTNMNGSFCPKCGQRYEEPLAEFCQQCGKKIGIGEMYCSSCGESTKLETNNNNGGNKKEFLIQNRQKKIILYSLNWVLLATILVLFFCFPIINISEKSKETLSYYIGDFFGGLEEGYTLLDMTSVLADNMVDVEEWNEIMNNSFISVDAGNLGVINGIITVVLFFSWLAIGLCVLMSIAYIISLINSYEEHMSPVKNGDVFSISVLILCFMGIAMLFAANMFFEKFDIVYTVSPYLIGIAVLAVVKWKVVIPMYNRTN